MSEVLPAVESALVVHFGHRPVRASVSFVGVDPIEVLRFEPIPGERAYLSLGMSRHPMTGAEASMLSQDGPRAELMLHLDDPADELSEVWRRVALLAAGPAVEGVVYADGMSVEIGEPLAPESVCVGVLVVASPLPAIPTGGGDVLILQALPATSNELAWCRVRGSAALRDLWREQQVDLLDLRRPQARLD